MKEIPLSQGKVALIDDEDYDLVNQFKWSASKDCHTFYALSGYGKNRKKMHRFIITVPDGMEVDHIDGNGLNNQKSNLRCVTHRCNTQNKHITKSSIYPGVYWDKSRNKWAAQITIKDKLIHLGRYITEEAAHNAYVKACDGV